MFRGDSGRRFTLENQDVSPKIRDYFSNHRFFRGYVNFQEDMCVLLVSFRRSLLENSNFLVESSRSCSSLSIRRSAPSNGRGGRRNSSSIPDGHGTNWETAHLIEFNINMVLKRMCLFMSTLPNVMKKH